MACNCGCGDSLSKGERMTLERLRPWALMDDAMWAKVVAEVEKAGGVMSTEGTAGLILRDALSKAYSGSSRSDAGRYAAEQRWKGHTKKAPATSTSRRLGVAQRFDPKAGRQVKKVKTLEEAYKEIAAGNYVELETAEQVATLIEGLGDYVKEVEKATGEKPNLDLCKVSVPGTNLFCGESIATDRFPEGVPRVEMPQLSGIPEKGSTADKMKRIDEEGNVDLGPSFVKKLASMGIRSMKGEVRASSLKASQHQLKGKNVSFFMSKKGLKVLEDPNSVIYVSRDGYVIDGHHRWAGHVAQDLKDGRTGDVKMKVVMIDLPIMQVLDAALDFSEEVGIQKKKA